MMNRPDFCLDAETDLSCAQDTKRPGATGLTSNAWLMRCSLRIKPRTKDPMMRNLLITASVLIAAACSSKSDTMSDELKKDLDAASSNDGLALASSGSQSQQVVSAIEQSPPAPRKIVASQRAVRHRRAEAGTPAPVEVSASTPSMETEPQSIENAPVATNNDAPVAPRPTPQNTQMPGGNGEGRSRSGIGSTGIGIGIEILGVVLRGGGVGEDHCEPPGRQTRRPPPPIAINSRIPVIRGTFPGRR